MASRNLGTLTLDLVAKIGGFERGMDQAARVSEKRMRQIQATAKKVGAAIGIALTAAATTIAVGVKNAIDEADKLNDLNQRLGISAEALSGFGYAAKQTGTDIESMARGLKLLAKNSAEALDASSEQAKLFGAMGISVQDAQGKLRSLEDLLPEIAEKFKELDDATLESALAQKLFGKSGDELIEFLNLGRDGIEQLRQKLRDMGGELDGKTLKAADDFNDTLSDIKTQVDAIYLQLAKDMLPVLQDLADYIRDSAKEGEGIITIFRAMGDVIGWLSDLFEDIANTVRGVTSVFLALGTMAKGVAQGITGSFDEAKVSIESAVNEMAEAWSRLTTFAGDKPKTMKAQALVEWIDPPKAGWHADTGLQGRLTNVLDGDEKKGKSKKSGLSDAEREAKQLEEAYQRMNAQMAETIALFGRTGEAVKVRYELEHGELAKLSEAKKAELIQQAEAIDQLERDRRAREAFIDLQEKEIDAIHQHKEAVQELLDDIAFETKLLELNNEQKQIAVELRRLNVDAASAEGQAITQAMQGLQEQMKQTELLDEFRSSFQDNVADVLSGTKSISDAFKSMGDMITQQIARIMAQKFTDWLFGGQGSSGGGIFGNLFGAFFGGGSSSSGASLSGGGGSLFSAPGFAGGTDFAPGGMAWVGEEGPELVNLPRGAQVIPAHESARMGMTLNQTINVMPGATRETAEQAARRAGAEARKGLARTG